MDVFKTDLTAGARVDRRLHVIVHGAPWSHRLAVVHSTHMET